MASRIYSPKHWSISWSLKKSWQRSLLTNPRAWLMPSKSQLPNPHRHHLAPLPQILCSRHLGLPRPHRWMPLLLDPHLP